MVTWISEVGVCFQQGFCETLPPSNMEPDVRVRVVLVWIMLLLKDHLPVRFHVTWWEGIS